MSLTHLPVRFISSCCCKRQDFLACDVRAMRFVEFSLKGNFQFTSQLVLAKPLRPFGTAKLFLQQPEGMSFCFWPHSPVLVPGMRKSSDEDELDEDEGKPSHHAHIMPSCRGEEEERSIKSHYFSGCQSYLAPTGARWRSQHGCDEPVSRAGLHCPLAGHRGKCRNSSGSFMEATETDVNRAVHKSGGAWEISRGCM